ncbi:unnamed protein product [Xylocopa violacea]|uniref:Uncharacterized protein n=1 Tax=Xylocopa violacea TaxID=135666 RepID=A0ABP1NTS5_XYLVO
MLGNRLWNTSVPRNTVWETLFQIIRGSRYLSLMDILVKLRSSSRVSKKNVFQEVTNFMEDPFVGAQDENSLEEIRSQQTEPYGTLRLIVLILSSCYHFLTNTFICSRVPLGSV